MGPLRDSLVVRVPLECLEKGVTVGPLLKQDPFFLGCTSLSPDTKSGIGEKRGDRSINTFLEIRGFID